MSQLYTDECFGMNHVVETDMQNTKDNFAALKSAFSGVTTPPDTIAGMWWYDTTANILKLRNEANTDWQSIWDFNSNKPIIANLSNDITGAMISSTIKNPATGTYGLRTIGTGSTTACAGNDYRLNNTRSPANNSVSISKLKIGHTYTYASTINTVVSVVWTLPGGRYGFMPTYYSSDAYVTVGLSFPSLQDTVEQSRIKITVSAVQHPHTKYGYVRQSYITSSGEVHWIFILRDKKTKSIISMVSSSDHPCFGSNKPLLIQHPFCNYDPIKHEIVVVNPSLSEIEEIENQTIVEDETLPDKNILQVITEEYEIDEDSNPEWPTKKISIGLPKHIKDKKTGRKTLIDYRFINPETVIEPIKKVIPKPNYIKIKSLRRK